MQIANPNQWRNGMPITQKFECSISWTKWITWRPFPIRIFILPNSNQSRSVGKNKRKVHILWLKRNWFLLLARSSPIATDSFTVLNRFIPLRQHKFHWDGSWSCSEHMFEGYDHVSFHWIQIPNHGHPNPNMIPTILHRRWFRFLRNQPFQFQSYCVRACVCVGEQASV